MVRHNIPTRQPADWVPPVPAFSAKIDEPVTIGYYCLQSRGDSSGDNLDTFLAWCATMQKVEPAPVWAEFAQYTDEMGHLNVMAMFYWRGERSLYQKWRESPEHESFWNSPEREIGDAGWYREVFHVPNERLETIFSDPRIDSGVGGGLEEHEGPIQAHNYWGSMRDRIPISAHEDLASHEITQKKPQVTGYGERLVVPGIHNLATIRSGQLFGEIEGEEKRVYENEIEPSVREGMLYLRDNPVESGCMVCRLMDETDQAGFAVPRSFAVAHFDSLRRLEQWSEFHPTHLRIFNRFVELATELRGDIKLRLWHEVIVTTEDMQEFEYINCDPMTGFLPTLVTKN